MACKVVRFEVCSARNERQDSSGYHSRVESGRAERGSNWLQAPLAAAAIGCRPRLPKQTQTLHA